MATYVQKRLSVMGLTLTLDESLAVVGVFCEAILFGLLRDNRVLITTFGAFHAKERRVAVNFLGQKSQKMRCISFRPSRRLLLVFRDLFGRQLDFEKLGDFWWSLDGAREESGMKSKNSSTKESSPASD